ncbi:MAG: hypothetical protein PF513_00915 [Tenericutes bacterium]|jgi:hypothetical protein|nr:hypothetical protein [Mycoplasmatota bacterium]
MNCIKTIKTKSIPHDVFIEMTKLYKRIGMNEYYEDLFSKSLDYYKQKTAEDNAKSFYQFFSPDFKHIPSSRLSSLTLDSSVANNRSEQLFKNIHQVFRKIHYESYEPFKLEVVEIRELVGYLFKDVIELPRYRKYGSKQSLLKPASVSIREVFENYLEDVKKMSKNQVIEPFYLYINFMIDFINMKVYDFKYNDLIGTLLFYILLIESGLNVSYYIGFFPKLLMIKEDYNKLLHQSSFQWEEGLSEVVPLTKFMIKIYKRMYDDLNDLARDIQYDKDLPIKKSDYIENIILKMPETFSKQDIRKKHPLVSDSTINRTLKRLQEDNVIRSLGKGRSAKWVKIVDNKDDKGQLKLHLGENNDD